MPENLERSKGTPAGYRDNRGQQPVRFGAYLGKVKSNVDPTRQGRLDVFIEALNDKINENDPKKWTTVSYCPPFYGTINPNAAKLDQTPAPSQSLGTFENNPVSYGMWFTPPDIGVTVLVFFLNGDPNLGVYTGVIPNQASNHMIPAIGASKNYTLANSGMQATLAKSQLLPVTELNENNINLQNNPKFYNATKPVHKIVAGQMFQQGLLSDNVRGPITSSSQRESPSAAYGISTPGRPIYANSTDQNAAVTSTAGLAKPGDVIVVGRQGGHTFVLDDGDISGKNNLVRIRSSSGHQITMSDDGETIYITHANGRAWIELGSEGTLDVFATNSINLRTKGQLNLHADKDININAGGIINMKSGAGIAVESATDISFKTKASFTVWTGFKLGLSANGILTMVSKAGSWNAGKIMALEAKTISLNGGKVDTLQEPESIPIQNLPDVAWNDQSGWGPAPKNLETIVTRAPTHEPYLYHNTGVDNSGNKVRLLGDTGDAAKIKFTGEIFGKDVAVVDMTPKFAVKQLNLANGAVNSASNTAAVVAKGEAAKFLDNVKFTQVSLNVNNVLATTANGIITPEALSLLNSSSTGQLEQSLSQLASSNLLPNNLNIPGISNLTKGALDLNKLGIGAIPGSSLSGLISGGGIGGAISGLGGTANGLATTLSDAAINDLSGLLNGAGIGGILGPVSTLISDNLGLKGLGGNINSLLGEGAAGELTSALTQLGVDANALSGNLGSIVSSLQGEFTGLIGGLQGDIAGTLGGLQSELSGAIQGNLGELTSAVSGLDLGNLSEGLASLGLADFAVPDIGSLIDFDISGMIGDFAGDFFGGFGDFGGFGGFF